MNYKTIKLALTCIAVLIFGQNLFGQAVPSELPHGDWSVIIKPYIYDKNFPISVTAVSSSLKTGLGVTDVKLAIADSIKRRPIEKIKLAWVIVNETNNNSVVSSGDSGFINLGAGNGISRIILNREFFSFASFTRNALPANNLKGKFRVNILVSYVEFSDGQKWNFEMPTPKSSVGYAPASMKRSNGDDGCANQGCSYSAANDSYYCSTELQTLCTNSGSSCTVSRCGGSSDLEIIIQP